MAAKIDEELRLVCKINRLYKEYEFDLLCDIAEIQEGISKLRSLIESYESMHISLKKELGTEYGDSYPDYDAQLALMTDWIISARIEIKKRKRQSVNNELESKKEKEQLDQDEQTRKIQEKLLVEEKYFRKKILEEVETLYEEDTQFISDIETNITSVISRLILHQWYRD